MTATIQPGDTVTVSIHALGFGGEGIARHAGFVLFVPRGVPGDKLRVRIVKLKKRYGSARVVEVLSPSRHRVPPDCAPFEAGCGGCQWLHIDYRLQIEWKRRLLEDALRRIGGLSPTIEEVVTAPRRRGCRNKLSLSSAEDGRLGLCMENSIEVVPLSICPMESPENNAALSALAGSAAAMLRGAADASDARIRSLQASRIAAADGNDRFAHRLPSARRIHDGRRAGRRLPGAGTPFVEQVQLRSAPDGAVSLFVGAETNDPALTRLARELVETRVIAAVGASFRDGFSHLAGRRSLRIRCGGLVYDVPTDVFFQTNYAQAEALLELVRAGIDVRPGDSVLDLYSGVGFFSLYLAASGALVTGVEGHPAAVAAARRTAARLKLRVRFIRRRIDPSLFAGGVVTGRSGATRPPRGRGRSVRARPSHGDALGRSAGAPSSHTASTDRAGRPPDSRYDRIVLDPPRGGCGVEVAEALCALGAE